MSKKQEEPEGLGAGCVFFFLAILVSLVVTYPWLLLLPLTFFLIVILGNRPKKVRYLPPPRRIPAPVPRTMVAKPPPLRTITPAPPPNLISPQVKVAPADFIPKDREYNKYLARAWDEEFEALAKKHEQYPPS
ncbi:hypothetical protein M1D88_16630 [Arthrobacter sp. R1-13]